VEALPEKPMNVGLFVGRPARRRISPRVERRLSNITISTPPVANVCPRLHVSAPHLQKWKDGGRSFSQQNGAPGANL
jgi:hypothetical protein